MAIPLEQQRIQPDAPVAEVPSEIHPLAAAFGGDIGRALEVGAEQVGSRVLQLTEHLQKMNELREDQKVFNLATKYDIDSVDWLYRKEGTVAKDSRTFKNAEEGVTPPEYIINVPTSPLMRQGNAANGSTEEADSVLTQNMQSTMQQARDEGMSQRGQQKLWQNLMTSFKTKREGIAQHEAKQIELGQIQDATASLTTLSSQMILAKSPNSINDQIGKIDERIAYLGGMLGWDKDKSEKEATEYYSKGMKSLILNNLNINGDIDQTKGLIESAKIPEALKTELNNYADLKYQQVKTQVERAEKNDLIQDRFNNIISLSDGKLNINDPDVVSQIALKDPKLGEALKKISDKNKVYKPENGNEALNDLTQDIFFSKNKEEVSEYLINALHKNANGEISDDELAILVNASAMRARSHSLSLSPEEASQAPDPKQLNIDSVVQSGLEWAANNGIKDSSLTYNILKGINQNMIPKDAFDAAIRSAVISKDPSVATWSEVPTRIKKNGMTTAVTFTPGANIYPHARLKESDASVGK